MRIKLTSPIRRDWTGHPATGGLLLDRDIGMGHGRLKLKLLVFKNKRSLRSFWRSAMDFNPGRALGVVHGLFQEVEVYEKSAWRSSHIECDPRYFAVMGLAKGHLSMEIICHESVHAAFAFAKRKSRTPWDAHARDFDEEAICYPAGRIAEGIHSALYASGMY